MRLPYGVQADEADAQAALAFIRPDRTITVNMKGAVDASSAACAGALGEELRDFVRGNIKARERMIAQYAVAGQEGLLVLGTDHAAEAVTGFYTKFGDGGVDLTPLSGLTRTRARNFFGTSARRKAPGARCPPPIWKTTAPACPTRPRWA